MTGPTLAAMRTWKLGVGGFSFSVRVNHSILERRMIRSPAGHSKYSRYRDEICSSRLDAGGFVGEGGLRARAEH